METGQLTKSDEKQNSTQDREQLNYKREERQSRKGKHGQLKRGRRRTKRLTQR